LREDLAEFYSPLIERVDVPDRSLREDAVFIESDQLAERLGRQFVSENHRRGTIALEHSMRHEPVGSPFSFHLLGSFAEGESLRLREDVGEQQVVMAAETIQRSAETDEVARNNFRSLMDELIERMLAVGAGSPQ